MGLRAGFRANGQGAGLSTPRRSRISWLAGFLGLLTAFIAALWAPAALAQTPLKVTLSVPANTQLAEGGGNSVVTVTASIASGRSADLIIDLSLGGTAKSTDYAVVGSLPAITITAGQTSGTGDVTLSAVDDPFFEGAETLRVEGTIRGRPRREVAGVDITIADNDSAPQLNVAVEPPGRLILEGARQQFDIVVSLIGGGRLEESATITVSLADDNQIEPPDERDFAKDGRYLPSEPPWTLTLPAGSGSATMRVTFDSRDDMDDEEGREEARLVAELDAVGTTLSKRFRLFTLADPIRHASFRVICDELPAYTGTTDATCHARVSNPQAIRSYVVTMTAEKPQLVEPDSATFPSISYRAGGNRSADMDVQFTVDERAAGETLRWNLSVTPEEGTANAGLNPFSVVTWPAADSDFQISDYDARVVSPTSGIATRGFSVFDIVFPTPRPVTIVGPPSVEIVLDSGVVSAPCTVEGARIRCIYRVQEGDYDFDRTVELRAGAVKFTGWTDRRDTTVSGGVASPLPAQDKSYSGFPLVFGGTHAIDIGVSPQSLQEGAGEQQLTITAQDLTGKAAEDTDVVIPLSVVDITTSPSDYSVTGTLSVTIPRGESEGRTTGVSMTAIADPIKENRIEKLRIEGTKGAMMTPFVRGAELSIIDSASIVLSVSPAEVAENGGAREVTVTAEWGDPADSVLPRDTEVTLSWGGTAGPGDYSRTGGATVTIPANGRSGTTRVTIAPTDDKLLEGNETVRISGTALGHSVFPADLTITDDEVTPAVTLAVDVDSLSEGGRAETVTVSATLDAEVAMANDETTVTLDLAGTAALGEDYTASWSPSSRVITIPRGETLGSNTVTLTLTPTDDFVKEDDETIVVQGTATTDMANRDLVVKVATITLQDDDALGVFFSPTALRVDEGSTATYEVWLGTQPSDPVTVSLSSTDSSVATVNLNMLTFGPTTWSTRQTVTVSGVDDNVRNGDGERTAEIHHTAAGRDYKDAPVATLPVTVRDDEQPVRFTIANASANEGQTIAFNVTRLGPASAAATVAWSTADDPDGSYPASAADYTAQTMAQTLSFAAGETRKTITVQTTQDTLDEEDETFLVELSSPSTGTSIADGTATGWILDDDGLPVLSIDAPSVPEGASGATATLRFTASLGAASGKEVTVAYAETTGGTATQGTDYEALTSGTLTFDAGETSKHIDITVTGDDVDEDNETVKVRLSSPSNATLSGGNATLDATGTITDDDTRGVTVSAASGGVSVAEADDSRTSGTRENEASYTVALTSEPTGTVTIELESGDTDVATVSPSSLEFTASDWSAKTVTVTGVSDDVDNADDRRTTRITHTVDAAGTDYEDETAASVPVTVTDDEDTPTVTLSLDPASIAESGNGNASTVTAALDRASHAAVTVTVSVPDGAPVTQTGTTLTIAAGATASTGTVTLTAVDNDVDAPDAAVAVSGDADGGGVADPADVTLAITDDDAAPSGVTLTTDTPTIAEDAATKTVKVTATVNGDTTYATDTTVRVTVGASNDSAISGTDYAAVTAFDIEIDAGEMSGEQTFSLDPADDAIDEDSESISVSGTSGALTITGTSIEITDDDTRGVTVSPTSLTVAEADTSGTLAEENKTTYTVVLTSEPTDDVTINIGVPEGAPFTVSDTGLDFTSSNWGTAQTVTVTASNDDIDNVGDARSARITHTVSADGTDYEDETAANVEVTVNDDDGLPVLSIDAPSVPEGASGATATLRFTASLGAASGKEVTVAYAETTGGTATQGTDYEALTSGTLTFDAGETSKHIDITVTGDDVDEDNETVKVRLSSPSNATLSGGNATLDATGTITDDDTRGVTVTGGPLMVAEADNPATNSTREDQATYTVVLDSEPTGTVTINIVVPEGAPFAVSPTSLEFTTSGTGIWSTAQEVTVTALDDDIDNVGDARSARITHTVSADGTDYEDETAANVEVTVNDDDTRGVTVSPTSLTVAEADTSGTLAEENKTTYTVVLTSEPTDDVTINIGVPEGAPFTVSDTGLDFTSSNWGTAQTVTVTASNDDIDNVGDARSARITHTVSADGTDYEDETAANVEVTVNDDDGLPVLSIDAPSVPEGASGATATLRFTASLGAASGKEVTVAYAETTGGTATQGTDYEALTSGTLTFDAGETSKHIDITVTGDDVDEDNETVKVRLSSPSNATLSGGNATLDATGTITDDDTRGVTVTGGPLMVAEADNPATNSTREDQATYTVVLDSEPTGTVTINIVVPEGAPFAVSPTSLEFTTSGTGIWSTAQEVTVTALDDDIDNVGDARSARITHTVSADGTDYEDETAANVEVTVNDDDTRGVTVSPTSLTVAEADTSGTLAEENKTTYTVVLTSEPTDDVTINIGVPEGAPFTVSDTGLDFTSSNWGTAQTVTVTASNDDIDNVGDARSARITHTVSADGTDYEDETAANVEVTVNDDDGLPVLSIDAPSVPEGASGATATLRFTASLGAASGKEVTVAYAETTGGTATQGTDYEALTSGTLTFDAGETSKHIDITVTGDDVDEDNETVKVRLSSPSNATLSGGNATLDATGTITDDDTRGVTVTGGPLMVAEADNPATNSTREDQATYTVVLDSEPTGTVTINIVVPEGAPFAVSPTSLEFTTSGTGIWSTAQEVTVTALDDDIDNVGDARSARITHTVSADGTDYEDETAANVEVTVNDDDTRGVTVSPTSLTVAEADTSGTLAEENKTTYTVVLTSEPTDDVTINIGVPEGAPFTVSDTGLDFTSSNWGTAQTVTVTASNDDIDNVGDARSARITHTVSADGTDYEDETAANVEVTVNDDDGLPVLSIDAPSVPEGASGATATLRFTASLGAASGKEVTVAYAETTGGTATQGTDYEALTSGTLTFDAGETSKHIDITVTGDDVDEDNETVKVRLSSPSNATLSGGNATLDATGTITDDDTRGVTVSAASGGVSVAEADDSRTSGTRENEASYTVALTSEPTGTVTIELESGDTDVATVSPSSLEFTASDWSAKTVTVTGVSDDVDNADDRRTTRITHTVDAAGTDYEDETAASVPVTVTDDEDTPTVTLSLDPASIAESGNGNASTVTAALDRASHAAVTVTVSVPDGAPVTQTGTTLTIAAGATASTGTVTLTAVDNDVDAPDAAVAVSGDADGGGVADPADVTLAITDDDAAPSGVTLTTDTPTIAEDAATKTVKVTATVNGDTTYATDTTVRVTVGASNDSAISGTDYAAVTAFDIEIDAGEMSGEQTFSLDPADDAIDEDSESISVSGTSGALTITGTSIEITDDDTRGVTVSPTSLTVAEADTSGTLAEENKTTYTVVLTSEPTDDVTINIGVPEGAPFTVSDTGLDFTSSNWGTAQTVTVTASNDDIDNVGDARSARITHTVSADGTDYEDETAANVEVTVNDDDGLPVLSIDAPSVPEGASGATATLRFTASLGAASGKEVTVAYAETTGGTATQGTDYEALTSGTLTFDAGETSKHIDITVTGDDVDEDNETVKVRLSSPSNATLSGGNATLDATGTITDDDTRGVTVTGGPLMVAEADNPATNSTREDQATYTVVLDSEPTGTVTINIVVPEGAPFAVSPTSLEFTTSGTGIWSTAQEVTVTALDDDIDNVGDARSARITHTVSADGTDYEDETAANVEVTVNDDDTRGVTVSPTSLTVAEADTSGTLAEENKTTYTVVLTSEPTDDVTINIGVPEGAPFTVSDTGLDFTSSNWGTAQTVTVTASNDDIDNVGDARSARITHTVSADGTDYEDETAANVEVTVNDDDGLPVLSIDAPSVPEGASGATATLRFTASLGAASGKEVTVAYAETTGGTATQGTDYEALTSGTLTFDAGETSKHIDITVTGDDVDEDNETVKVRLSSPSNATLSGGNATLDATGTITDDDTRGVTVTGGPLMVAEADNPATNSTREDQATYTVVLDSEPTGTVTINIVVPEGAPFAVSPTSLEFTTSGTGIWSTAQEVTVTALDDDIDNVGDARSARITHTVSADGTDYEDETAANVEVTVNDDDTRGVTVSPTSLTVAEADTSGTLAEENKTTYTVVLTSEPTDDVTINIGVPEGAPFTVSDTGLDFTSSNWGTAQTVTVTASNDDIDNVGDARSARITHTVSADGTDYEDETAANVEVTVNDDDGLPVLSIDAPSVPEGASGATATLRFTASLGAASGKEVTVAYAETTGGTATQGTDYEALTSGTLTFDAGETSKHIDITVTGDDVDEDNETVKVRLSSPSNATLSGGNATLDATGTITDDDTRGVTVTGGPLMVAEADNPATNSTREDQATYTVVLDSEPTGTVTINIVVPEGAPFAVSPTSLEFTTSGTGIWSTAQEVTVTALDDDIDNVGDARSARITHTVSADGTDYEDETAANVEVTVNDDDTRGVTVSPTSLTVAEADTSGTLAEENKTTYTVVLTSEPTDDVTINIGVPEGAPFTVSDTGLDFTSSNWGTAQTVTVTASNDDIDNVGDARSARITHTVSADGTDYEDETAANVEVTVNDDDGLPVLSIDAPSVPEGASGATATLRFTASLGAASGKEVTVAYAETTGGTATQGTDYEALTSGTLTFDAGETSKHIDITVTGDDVDEDNETVKVRLSSPSNATLSGGNATLDATGTITDDDTRGVTVSAASGGVSVAEADDSRTSGTRENEASYTVALTSEPTGTVTIELESGDTDVATVSPSSLEFTASDWSAKTVTVTGVSDDVDNADDRRTTRITHTVDAAGTDYEDETAASVPVTVTDDEDTPTVTLSLDPASIAESGNGNASTVTAALDRASHAAVTVTVSVPDGAPVTQTGTTLTIAAGATASTGTVTLTAVDNDVDAPDAAVAVSGDADGGGVADPADVTLAITDDDAAPSGVTLTTDTPTIAEDAATKTVKVTATVNGDTTYATDTTVRVTVGASNDSAISGTDYAAVTAFDIEIDAGEMSGEQTFSLDPADDAIDEDSESISVSGTSGALTITGTSIEITDDDTRGVTVSPTSLTVAEADTSGTLAEENKTTYTVVLTSEPTDDVTINIGVPEGAPFTVSDTGLDFTSSNWGTAQTVTVTASNDDIDNVGDARSARITHTVSADGTDYEDETAANVEVTVNDDDGLPVLSIDAPSVPEGASGATATLRFTASLGAASGKEVTVAYAETTGGTATQGTDYEALTSGTLTFDAGETSKHIDITVTGDDVDEDNETVKVRLSSPSNATLSGGNATLDATGTITDDDTRGVTVILTPTTIAESGATNASTVTARLSGASSEAVTLTVAATAVAPATSGDFALSSATTLTIAAGGTSSTGTVTVTAVDDQVDGPNKSITVSATVSGGHGVANPGNATLTITDDDPTKVTLSAPSGPIAENGGTKTLTVTLGRALTGDEALDVPLTLRGVATFGDDYTLAAPTTTPTGVAYSNLASDDLEKSPPTVSFSGVDNAASSATLTLTAKADNIDESVSERVTVALGALDANSGTNLDGGASGMGTVEFAITEDDGEAPTVAIGGLPAKINSTAELSVTFEFSEAVTGFETGDVTVTGGTKGAFSGSGRAYTLAVTPTSGSSVTVTVAANSATDGGGNTGPSSATSATAVWDATAPTVAIGGLPAKINSTAELSVTFEFSEAVTGFETGDVTVTGGTKDTFSGSGATYTLAVTPDGAADVVVTVQENSATDGANLGPSPAVTKTAAWDATAGDLRISIDDAEGMEGGYMRFRVHLSAPSPGGVRARWHTHPALPQTATIGSDYEDTGGDVIFDVGEQEKWVEVWVIEDGVDDPWETFEVWLHSPEGTVLSDPVTELPHPHDPSRIIELCCESEIAHGRILQTKPDPDPVEVSFTAAQVKEEEGGSVSLIARLAKPIEPHILLWIPVVYSNGTAEAEDYAGAGVITIFAGLDEGSVTIDIAEDADTDDETFSVSFGELPRPVRSGAVPSVELTIVDDVGGAHDEQEGGASVTLSVDDASVEEGPNAWLTFTVRLSGETAQTVTVNHDPRDVTATYGEDYTGGRGTLMFHPSETEKEIRIAVLDDAHDEGAETMELVLSDARGARIDDGVGVGTIVNADPMPGAWLARFGRTVAEQALDGIADRMAAPRTAGVQGTLAGQALSSGTGSGADGAANENAAIAGAGVEGAWPLALSGLDAPAGRFGTSGFGHDVHGFGQGFPQSRTMTGLEALLGSSFTATGETDGLGGSLAFWGQAAQSSFDGREGTFSLDGEATTAMLGADYARGDWLAGLALVQSSGEGGYADSGTEGVRCLQPLDAETREVLCGGAVREGDGEVEASLTAAVPYAALQASERLKLWGAAGVGTGEVTLEPETGGSLGSDITWTMAAAGARSDLLAAPREGSGPALALTMDALWTRTSSEKTHELAASDSDVTRLRLGLEGSYGIATAGGGSLTPRAEIGARHDGGDAETGFGLEIGGGLAWTDPTLGLSLDFSGRTLIAHGDDDLEDRGFAASMVFDPNPSSERGLSLTLRQDWGGPAQGGFDALFAADPLADRAGEAETESRWQAEAAYGLPVFSGRFTGSPHVGLSLGTSTRDYTLGWRLTPEARANAPELSFGVKATRREGEGAAPEHAVGVELRARW